MGVIIQGINVLEPFKIENDNGFYKYDNDLNLMYYSFSDRKWNRSYLGKTEEIINCNVKITSAMLWSKVEIIFLENLYLFGYTNLIFEQDKKWHAYKENNQTNIILDDSPEYQILVELLNNEDEYQYKIKDILDKLGSEII